MNSMTSLSFFRVASSLAMFIEDNLLDIRFVGETCVMSSISGLQINIAL